MYKEGDKFEIEIEKVLEHENTCLYRIRGFHSLIFDNYGLNRLKKIDAPKVEKELHRRFRPQVGRCSPNHHSGKRA